MVGESDLRLKDLSGENMTYIKTYNRQIPNFA